MKKKELFKLTSISAFLASLCCVTPIVIVLLGLSTVSTAAALGNTLYYDYRWIFILLALTFLSTALVIHFRKQGICSLGQAKRNKNKIINTVLIVLFIAVFVYLIFNYVILEFIGYGLGIWELPF
jgi:membrane protein insertase Oxa1/YidC/SpoIIIJ